MLYCFVVAHSGEIANSTYEMEKFIAPGTKIISDGWKAYKGIEEMGLEYIHGPDETVNHSKEFTNAAGQHTNTIEAKWGGLKKVIPRNVRRQEKLGPYLVVEMWRKVNAGNLWNAFLRAIRRAEYL